MNRPQYALCGETMWRTAAELSLPCGLPLRHDGPHYFGTVSLMPDLEGILAERDALATALRDRSRDAHALNVRLHPMWRRIFNPSCSGAWESCPSPYCSKDRAMLGHTEPATPDG